MVSAVADDLEWISDLNSKMRLGVEVKDFSRPDSRNHERAFELWNLWREATSRKLPLVVHAPFLDLIPFSPEPEVAELAAKKHEEVLNIAGILKADGIIFHSGYNPLIRAPEYYRLWVTNMGNYFRNLMEKHPQLNFFIENMWESSTQPLLELADSCGDQRLKICLDIGHVRVYSEEPPDIWVQQLGARLGHVHVNDNDGEWDQELALGAGSINVRGVFESLNQLGYNGPICIEMHGREAALRSMDFLVKNDLA